MLFMHGFRILIPSIVVLLLAGVCHADSRLGLRGGVNFGNVRYQTDFDHEPKGKAGLLIQATVQGSLASSRIIYLEAEVGYIDRGWEEDAEFMGDPVTTEFIVPELTIGLATVIRLHAKQVRPFLETGIELGAVTRKEAYVVILDREIRGELMDYSSSNVSLSIGAGIAVPHKRNEWQFLFRYNHGLKNMFDTLDDESIKTTAIQLIAGYSFTLKQ